MNNNWLIVLIGCLGLSIVGLVVSTAKESREVAYADIEKKCLYGERLEFSGKIFSCQWLEGVTIDNQQYERKPHPLKEILK